MQRDCKGTLKKEGEAGAAQRTLKAHNRDEGARYIFANSRSAAEAAVRLLAYPNNYFHSDMHTSSIEPIVDELLVGVW